MIPEYRLKDSIFKTNLTLHIYLVKGYKTSNSHMAHINHQNILSITSNSMATKPLHTLYLCASLLLSLCIHISLAHRVSLTSVAQRNGPNQDVCCSIDGNCGPCNGGNGNCCSTSWGFCYTCAAPPTYNMDFNERDITQGNEPGFSQEVFGEGERRKMEEHCPPHNGEPPAKIVGDLNDD